jgi:hypothetical protein
MTQLEYEQQYADALDSLRRRGNLVRKPYYSSHDRVRAVTIDGFPCIDDLVFEKAWGKDTAASIAANRPSPH